MCRNRHRWATTAAGSRRRANDCGFGGYGRLGDAGLAPRQRSRRSIRFILTRDDSLDDSLDDTLAAELPHFTAHAPTRFSRVPARHRHRLRHSGGSSGHPSHRQARGRYDGRADEADGDAEAGCGARGASDSLRHRLRQPARRAGAWRHGDRRGNHTPDGDGLHRHVSLRRRQPSRGRGHRGLLHAFDGLDGNHAARAADRHSSRAVRAARSGRAVHADGAARDLPRQCE